MKRSLFVAVVVSALSLNAFSQSMNDRTAEVKSNGSSSTTKSPSRSARKNEMMVSQGIRVSLYKPFYDNKLKVEARNGNQSASDSDKIDGEPAAAFGIGYAFIPLNSVGIIGSLSYFKTDFEDDDGSESDDQAKIAVLEGSATYGFAPQFYGKAGLNVLRIVGGGKEVEKFDGGVGLQVGVGFEATENFGLDFSYKRLTAERSFKAANNTTVDVEILQYGPEFGVHATF